jgi:hypothetical protein
VVLIEKSKSNSRKRAGHLLEVTVRKGTALGDEEIARLF